MKTRFHEIVHEEMMVYPHMTFQALTLCVYEQYRAEKGTGIETFDLNELNPRMIAQAVKRRLDPNASNPIHAHDEFIALVLRALPNDLSSKIVNRFVAPMGFTAAPVIETEGCLIEALEYKEREAGDVSRLIPRFIANLGSNSVQCIDNLIQELGESIHAASVFHARLLHRRSKTRRSIHE